MNLHPSNDLLRGSEGSGPSFWFVQERVQGRIPNYLVQNPFAMGTLVPVVFRMLGEGLEYRNSAGSESPQYPANGPTWELGTPKLDYH